MKLQDREQGQQSNGKAKKASRLSGWVLIPLALSMIMLFVFSAQWKESLVVQKFEVEGARILAAKDVVTYIDIKPQSAMYRIDLFDAEQRLLAQPMIKSATITRLLTNALRVVIKEREPIASLGGSELRYIDSEGVLLPHQKTTVQFDLPLITGIGGLDTVQCGKISANPEIMEAIEVVQDVQATGFNHAISEVNMNNGGDIIIYSIEGGIPVLLGRGGMMKKMLTLETFWGNFMKTDSLNNIQYVDARYEGQVVVKRNQQNAKPQLKMQM